MKWWNRLRGRTTNKSIGGAQYRIITTLYSFDGKRSAEIREFSHGDVYLLEAEWVEGTTFRARHGGRLVGPFVSPKRAEQFIVATAWFNKEPDAT